MKKAHADRLLDGVRKRYGAKKASELELSLGSAADSNDYANALTEILLQAFPTAEVPDLLSGAHCGHQNEMTNRLHEAFLRSPTLTDFSISHDEINPHISTHVEDDAFMIAYPTCYCPIVAKGKLRHPDIWCQCTVGYVKKIYGAVFGREINPVLLKSIKQGDEACVIKIPGLRITKQST